MKFCYFSGLQKLYPVLGGVLNRRKLLFKQISPLQFDFLRHHRINHENDVAKISLHCLNFAQKSDDVLRQIVVLGFIVGGRERKKWGFKETQEFKRIAHTVELVVSEPQSSEHYECGLLGFSMASKVTGLLQHSGHVGLEVFVGDVTHVTFAAVTKWEFNKNGDGTKIKFESSLTYSL